MVYMCAEERWELNKTKDVRDGAALEEKNRKNADRIYGRC